MRANSKSCIINLTGDGRHGLLKKVVQEFGPDLESLKEREHVLDAKLVIKGRKREMHLWGSSGGLAEASSTNNN